MNVLSERILFSGEAGEASIKGQVISAKFRTGALAFDQKIPRVRIQAGCNNTLFDVGCGLVADDWTFSAFLDSPGSAGWPFVFALATLERDEGDEPDYVVDYFAGGWFQIGQDRIAIRSSTLPVSGALTLTLARDPEPFPEGDELCLLVPGCDGRRETCIARFANYVNFLGHPFIPTANPSLVKLSSAAAGGKK